MDSKSADRPTINQPWSTISDERLGLLEQLYEALSRAREDAYSDGMIDGDLFEIILQAIKACPR